MSIELWGILLYVLLQLVVASFLLRRVSSAKDYFLAGRSLGPVLATFSVFATWFGAEICMGTSGRVYASGVSGGRADPFGYAGCLLIFGLIFAARLWKKNLTTLGDLYHHRFSENVERYAVFLMIPTSVMWAAAQIRAFGQVLSASSGLEITVAITIATTIVIAYTAIGGMMADCVNDLVHGICLIIGMLVLVIAVTVNLGGLENLTAAISPERLTFFPSNGESLWQRMDHLAVPLVGSLVAQELVSRSLSSRSAKVAKGATLIAAATYLLIGLMPVFLGLVGPAVIPNLSDPEQLLPQMAHKYLPTFFYIIFAGALVAAILSTVDSALLAVSALLSQNFLFPIYPDMTDRQKVKVARLTVLICGAVAYFMAIFGHSIYELVQVASSWGSSGLVVITLFALFGRFGGPLSAHVAMTTGLIALPVAESLFELQAPYIFSLAASLAAYVLTEVMIRVAKAPSPRLARAALRPRP